MCGMSPGEQMPRWECVRYPVRITGEQEESIHQQMDDRSAGVGEGQDGRDTKASTLTGCAISQGAKPCSPAKARPRQAKRAGCDSPGDIRLEKRQ